jgi:glycosyltransferase involved in cell wall biosynthesis
MHMRVLVATPLYPPEPGGPATYAKLLEEGLPARGVDIVLVKFGDVKRLPSGLRHLVYFFKVLASAASCDLIYALDAASVGLPAMWAARFLRKPFIVKIVGDYAWEQGRQRFGVTLNLDEFVREEAVAPALQRFRKVQTSVALHARKVIVPSEYLKRIVLAWGIPEERVQVIYNSISHAEIEDVKREGRALPEATELPRPLIVTVGRLVPWKHIDGVIEAARKLRGANIPVSLAVIGDGPKDAELKDAARRMLPEGNWIFSGAQPHEVALATAASADVFVLNSSYEGLSHVLIEAALLGVPIVATKVGGNPEVVVDGENGLLVPAGDTDALAAAIRRVIEDAELRARIAANAKGIAEKFLDDTMLADVAAMLKAL